jgi:hypothetical protein
VERIRLMYQEGSKPSQILHTLRAQGRGREIADYMYAALQLDPDAVPYIYAWINGSVSNERLDEWLNPMLRPELMNLSTIIFASDAKFPDATSFLVEYLATHGYRVIPARSAEAVLEIIDREPIDCVVLTAPLALHPLDSGQLLIQALPAIMPTVTFGNSRGRDRDWIGQCSSRRNQEYCHFPVDLEDLLLKMRKVISAE